MKNVITLFLLLPLFSFSQKDSMCILKGHITGLGNGELIFYHLIDDPKKVYQGEHIKAHNDNFTYAVRMTEPTAYRVNYHQKKTKHRKFVFHTTQVFLQSGNLTMTGLLDSLEKAEVRGSPINDEMMAEKKEANAIYDRLLKGAQAKDTTKKVRYLNKEQIQPVLDFTDQYIRSHPSSYLSASLLFDNYSYDILPQVSGPLLAALDEHIQSSVPARVFKKRLDIAIKTDLGTMAPDIILPDVNGKNVSLSSFRGKVTLLDFWASWCGPCRMENPSLVKAYKHYRSKGFDIYSVSLDATKTAWKTAIAKDSLTWTHVSDLKGWKSEAAQLYGIKAIPGNILIDSNGIVIAKNLRDDELEKKLSEIFK